MSSPFACPSPEKALFPYGSSKRWQNLNVVLPLYIPYGTVAVTSSTGENSYVFPDTFPSAQLLFSGAGRVCDIGASYLRLRVAVVHKCPDFLVPRVALAFRTVLEKLLPRYSEPIRLRCKGMVKHTIQLRSSGGGVTFRYDTLGQLTNSGDKEKMKCLIESLQQVMIQINEYIAREEVPMTGLEFRFSPCKELKIPIREGSLCDCTGVDAVIAGGGASTVSAWAQQFVVDNVVVGEVRLEKDKTTETQLDPAFMPEYQVVTRMITRDTEGVSARVCFVQPSIYPSFYRPLVQYALGLTPLQAAEKLCNANHKNLAQLLPNGIASLIHASYSGPAAATAAAVTVPSLFRKTADHVNQVPLFPALPQYLRQHPPPPPPNDQLTAPLLVGLATAASLDEATALPPSQTECRREYPLPCNQDPPKAEASSHCYCCCCNSFLCNQEPSSVFQDH